MQKISIFYTLTCPLTLKFQFQGQTTYIIKIVIYFLIETHSFFTTISLFVPSINQYLRTWLCTCERYKNLNPLPWQPISELMLKFQNCPPWFLNSPRYCLTKKNRSQVLPTKKWVFCCYSFIRARTRLPIEKYHSSNKKIELNITPMRVSIYCCTACWVVL